MSSSTNNTQAAAPQIFGYHATTEAAVASAAAMQGLLGLIVNKDNTKTLGAQIDTMGTAGITEAHDARSELICQAAGTAAQALGQFASAGASVTSAVVSYASTYSLSKQQGALKEQLGEAQTLQDQFRNRQTGPDMHADTFFADNEELPAINNSTQSRIEELAAGKISNADALGLTSNEYAGLSADEKAIRANAANNINQDALDHMPVKGEDFKAAKSQVDDQVKGLITNINTLSNDIQSRQGLVNMLGQAFKEAAGGFGATGQSIAQGIQSMYACNKQLMGTVGQLTNQEMGVLSKMIDSANQSIDSSASMVLQAAQITSSAA